jgi:hypothetical protein
VNLYNNRLLPLIRQFFLILNRVNDFVDLSNVSLLLESVLLEFDHCLAIYTFSTLQ